MFDDEEGDSVAVKLSAHRLSLAAQTADDDMPTELTDGMFHAKSPEGLGKTAFENKPRERGNTVGKSAET